jgi:MFS family permease
MTAGGYILFSVPAGRAADAWGRSKVLLFGYAVIGVLYAVLLTSPTLSGTAALTCVFGLGLYYAATEGVLQAIASSIIPPDLRATGLAALATAVAVAKMAASLLFGWVWQVRGATSAVAAFGICLAGALALSAALLWRIDHGGEPS